MTVRDLRKLLKGLPANMQVKVHDEHELGPTRADALQEHDYIIFSTQERIEMWRAGQTNTTEE